MSFLQTILGELEMISLDEIENIPHYNRLGPYQNDEVVGIVEDVFTRKVYFLACEYTGRIERIVDRIKSLADPEDVRSKMAKEMMALYRKYELLDGLFWIAVRDELDCWEPRQITIRDGWRVVKSPPPELDIEYDHFIDYSPNIIH